MGGAGGMRRALGLMSGTSMDGIDVAVLDTDGGDVIRPGPTGFAPFDDHDRGVLRDALAAATALVDRNSRPAALARAEALVTDRHAAAVERVLAEHGIPPDSIDVVGFHGQTVLHRPERGLTVQLGDGAALAARLGIDVVADLRAADMLAGGQGAPLVPIYHRALVRAAGLPGTVLVVNVGGVANVTLVSDDRDPVAGDTGPGNALLDDLMLARTGLAMDRDGSAGARGRIDEAALAALMAHPFFALPLPKSLDRNAFSAAPVSSLATDDAAATLTAFTAASIAAVLPHLPQAPRLAVVCGGGARNPTLMTALGARLGCPVQVADALGWNGDAVEAQAFAYLAVRSLLGLPLTFPGITGVPRPVKGGVLHRVRAARAA